MSKVLILMGSPRKKGNTKILCDEFARGAEEAGHDVETVVIRDLDIGGCLGCSACQRNGGECVQKDDMRGVYGKVEEADAIVLGSCIYYYTWTSQMKAVLDRFYPVTGTLRDKTFYLISACAAGEEAYTETMLDTFEKFVGCFRAGGNAVGGHVFGMGTVNPGDVEGSPAMQRAYEMGKSV